MTIGRWPWQKRRVTKTATSVLKATKDERIVLRPTAKVVARKAPQKKADSAASAALVCSSVQDWLEPHCDQYRGLHVRRPPSWGDIQEHVDRLASNLGREESIKDVIMLSGAKGSDDLLAERFSKSAQRLVGKAIRSGLPEFVGEHMKHDIEEICMVVTKMLPSNNKLIVKLEVMGENCCSRWHQDHYTARAISTYSGMGTEYVHHDNVNFWELEHCGNNDHILLDRAQVFSADAGDILFMKGKLFPGTANGLVHKSPEKRYDADGVIMNRLCLKIDAL